jgi:putative ABC transport system substrate-binding protein
MDLGSGFCMNPAAIFRHLRRRRHPRSAYRYLGRGTVGRHFPSTSIASSWPGHGGIVTPTAGHRGGHFARRELEMRHAASGSVYSQRMDRRRTLTALAAFCAAPSAWAQSRRVHRIGVLETTSLRLNAENFDRFRKGMEERGYVEGPGLVILYRSADGHTERYPGLAAELVRLKVDLILTRGTPATLAAKRATSTIPIVMAAVGDPVENRLAASLARPGGNVTGLTSATAELVPRRLELLKALVPKMTRVAAYSNQANAAAAAAWREIEIAARAMGLEPQLLDVRAPEQIAPAFAAAARGGAQGLIVGIETLTQSNRKAIVELAATHRLPAMYSAREFVEAGGLVSYGVSYPDLYYRAAGFADRILKGAAPGALPIERPAKFSLYINRRAARALDVVVPPDILLRADRTLE